jgi:hypothetical protein
MRLALLLMLWLTGCADTGLRHEPRPTSPGIIRHGWTAPNMARPGREHPETISITCAGCSLRW